MRLRLRKPLERAILSGHPWVFRDAFEPYEAAPGQVVEVIDKRGRFLCRGLAEGGPIGVRVFSTRDEPLDKPFFEKRIHEALALRTRVVPEATSAYRLLHGEGDGLPGITCDRFAGFAVLKLDGEAAAAWEEKLVQWLREPLRVCGIKSLLTREGKRQNKSIQLAWGSEPPEPLVIEERGVQLAVNLREGQKTGFFLDHRDSRHIVRQMSHGLRVLDLYGYTGGFSVSAGLGGATEVTTVDITAAALDLARQSWRLNGLYTEKHRTVTADVPEFLGELDKDGARFGLVIADPPSFAPKQSATLQAQKSYAALHCGALGVIEAGGFYLAASCSSHIKRQQFDDTLQEGARRARRRLQILGRWETPSDHPRLLSFPEGNYLKVTLSRVL
jgi:23S rRNA (cytosine1962-C5)-methyltransferase